MTSSEIIQAAERPMRSWRVRCSTRLSSRPDTIELTTAWMLDLKEVRDKLWDCRRILGLSWKVWLEPKDMTPEEIEVCSSGMEGLMTTHIQWTDETWNPTSGCTKISPGCLNCYIERTPPMRIAGRKFVNGKIPLELHENRLETPLKWKKPKRIFVNSMSDLFHEDVPDEFIDRVFAVMALCPQHTFQILTKRAERMASYVNDSVKEGGRWDQLVHDGDFPWPDGIDVDCPSILETATSLPNVWLGVSVENQEQADKRIPLLLQTPAAVRFLSMEPLLGPVRIEPLFIKPIEGTSQHGQRFIDWVIVGGESGPNARPMHPDWARSIRDQCQAAMVPFFFKQIGEWGWGSWKGHESHCMYADGRHAPFTKEALTEEERRSGKLHDNRSSTLISKVGKKAAGRDLDGRTWDEFPEVAR